MGIFEQLKNAALKRKIQAQGQVRQSENMSLRKAQKIGLLVDMDQLGPHLPLLQSFASELKQQGKDLVWLGFTQDKQAQEHGFDFPLLNPKQQNWTGLLQGPEVDAFLAQTQDLLFALYLQPCPALDALCQLSPAALRYGPQREDLPELFDVSIYLPEGKKDLPKFIQGLRFALQEVNQTKNQLKK